MNMKRILLWIVAGLTVFCTAGCNNDYSKRIEELKAKADSLEVQCNRLNASLSSVSKIINAIQENDLITETAEIKEGGKVIGYKINFVSGSPITVYNGADGLVPYVGTKQDTDGSIYWTVRYGTDGSVDWLLDDQKRKVLAVGDIPYLDIKDDMWQYTFDGKTWLDLGPAKGTDADSMFREVDVSDELFVVFHLADGMTLTIPKYDAYRQLLEDVSSANEAIAAQKHFLETMFGSAVYIVSLEDDIVNGTRTGVKVSLSDGSSFVIKDCLKYPVPIVLAEKDTTDGVFYWTCRYEGERGEPFWLTDSDGNRVKAQQYESGDMPVVNVRMNEEDGNYYWYLTYPDGGHFLTDTDGKKIAVADSSAFAADSQQYKLFESLTYDEDCLELVLREGGEPIRIMRQFAVTLESDDLTGKTLEIEDGQSAVVAYEATGAQVENVVAITEGNISVSVDLEECEITVSKNGSGSGAVSLIFTFAGMNSTNTRFVKLKVQGTGTL